MPSPPPQKKPRVSSGADTKAGSEVEQKQSEVSPEGEGKAEDEAAVARLPIEIDAASDLATGAAAAERSRLAATSTAQVEELEDDRKPSVTMKQLLVAFNLLKIETTADLKEVKAKHENQEVINAELKAELIEVKAKHENQEVINYELKAELIEVKAEHGETKAELIEVKAKHENQEVINAELKEELIEVKAKHENQEVINAALNAKLEKTNAELIEVKAEHGETKAELIEVKAELGKTKEELEKTKEELEKTNAELIDLKGRMNNFMGAFEPAIQYALFETFVFDFVHLELDYERNNFKSDNEYKIQVKNNGQIKYKMSILCRGVMNILLDPKYVPKMDIATPTPKDKKKAVWLRALQSLVEYVSCVNADMDKIKRFVDAEKRNEMSHNGLFLIAFFPSLLPSSDISEETAKLSEEVKICYDQINERINNNSGPKKEIKDAVTALVETLKTKGVQIVISEKVKNQVVGLLEETLEEEIQ